MHSVLVRKEVLWVNPEDLMLWVDGARQDVDGPFRGLLGQDAVVNVGPVK